MSSILAKIQREVGRLFCFVYSALFLMCAFALLWPIVWDDSSIGLYVFLFLLSLTGGILLLAAGLHDPDRDESITAEPKPLIFITVDENGKIIKKDFSAPPPLGCKETRRADGKVDISLEIHSKEQAVEVLAALAVMYDKGDIAANDYNCNVHKIREHFNL